MPRPSWMGSPRAPTPSRPTMPAMDRILRCADLLAQGAEVEKRTMGTVWLWLDGSVAMHTTAQTVKAAREMGQGELSHG